MLTDLKDKKLEDRLLGVQYCPRMQLEVGLKSQNSACIFRSLECSSIKLEGLELPIDHLAFTHKLGARLCNRFTCLCCCVCFFLKPEKNPVSSTGFSKCCV